MSDGTRSLSHIDSHGAASMVDVSDKDVTRRTASASARVTMSSHTLETIRRNELKKGEAIGTARIAGILAAKRVSELIPLCHSISLTAVAVDFAFEVDSILITSAVTTDAKTGVEMEALTACTVAALTLYDMAKALDRSMVISDIKLLSKTGGRSGLYQAKEQI